MSEFNQRGAVNILLVPLILMIVLCMGAAGFAVWAFAGRTDYKDNSDKKVAAAVAEAIAATQESEAAKNAEANKKPYDTYIGPAPYGNITVNYPKTWSAYVLETERGTTPVVAYFQPKIVPNIANKENNFALRVELSQTTYEAALDQFKARLDQGQVTIKPYTLAKVPSVVGSRIEGQITTSKQGTMIVLPLRNMTLKIWTEANDFKADLDTHILPNLSFVP